MGSQRSGATRPKSATAVLDHRLRRAGLQSARLAAWHVAPRRWPRPVRYGAAHPRLEVCVAEIRASIVRTDAHADPMLEAGKQANLRLAAPAFDDLVLAPDHPLSFWRTLGRPSERRGFSWGMALRGGCVVPAIAGGLCLLSNVLFELAVRGGLRILERHGHSLEAVPPLPGSLVLDATVAWPDVDLVVAPVLGLARLRVRVEGDELHAALLAERASGDVIALSSHEEIVHRGADRVRTSRVWRRRTGADGRSSVDEVAAGERRLLTADELGRSCLDCGEHACRDRPAESVLVTLRPAGRRGR